MSEDLSVVLGAGPVGRALTSCRCRMEQVSICWYSCLCHEFKPPCFRSTITPCRKPRTKKPPARRERAGGLKDYRGGEQHTSDVHCRSMRRTVKSRLFFAIYCPGRPAYHRRPFQQPARAPGFDFLEHAQDFHQQIAVMRVPVFPVNPSLQACADNFVVCRL